MSVRRAEQNMNRAYRDAMASRQILKDGPLGRAFDDAYVAWIRARWDTNDPWVRSIWEHRP